MRTKDKARYFIYQHALTMNTHSFGTECWLFVCWHANDLTRQTTFLLCFWYFVVFNLCARAFNLLFCTHPFNSFSFSISLECEKCLYKQLWQWYVRFYVFICASMLFCAHWRWLRLIANVPSTNTITFASAAPLDSLAYKFKINHLNAIYAI